MTRKTVIIGFVTFISLLNVPFMPNEAHLEFAYQYKVGSPREYFDLATNQTLPTPDADFVDADQNGIISVAVFSDFRGNKVYVNIPDSKYEDMGKVNGWLQNPQRTEYNNLLDILVPNAQALITIGNTTDSWVASASSLTFTSFSASGDTNAIIVSIFAFNSTATFTSATFNGNTMTDLGNRVADLANSEIRMAGISSTNATANIVINYSANKQIFGTVANYVGVDSINPIPSYGQTGTLTNTSFTQSTTTAFADQWLVMAGRSPAKTPTAGADTVVRRTNAVSGDAAWILDSGTGQPAGTPSLNWSYTGSSASYWVMAQLNPSTALQIRPTIRLNNGTIRINNGTIDI